MKLFPTTFILALLCVGTSVVTGQTYQGASQAPNGTGKYKSQIYWVNWDANDKGYPDDTLRNIAGSNMVRQVEVPGGITYTITLTQNGNSTELISYVSGWWDWDDFTNGYNWFKNGKTPYNFRYYIDGTGTLTPDSLKYNYYSNVHTKAYNNSVDAHNSVVGLKNRYENNTANFNITITGVYTGTTNPVPSSMLKGFVFAGAESLQGNGGAFNNATHEYYTLSNLSNSNPWRIIDTFQSVVPSGYVTDGNYVFAGYHNGFSEIANVTDTGKVITLYNGNGNPVPPVPSYPPKPGNGNSRYYEGPGDVVWMADAATNVDVKFKGNGYTAIAVGFIYSTDLGDAPASYGQKVTNIQEVSFQGGNLPYGNGILIKNSPLATLESQKLLLGQYVDGESIQIYSAHANSDDSNQTINDEDALTAPGAQVEFVRNSLTQSITVPVKNQLGHNARLFGWIDVNQNGIFDSLEVAQVLVPENNTTATLNWILKDSMKVNQPYLMRLRILDATNTNIIDNDTTFVDERALLSFVFGETEDHEIEIFVPLPLTISPLKGTVLHCDNKLTWETYKEEDGAYFELETSANGKDFQSLFKFELMGAGHQYSYTDEDNLKRQSFYRLKLVDLDGSYSYSITVQLFNNCKQAITIYPTPTAGSITVKGANVGQSYTITNTAGQVLMQGVAISEQFDLDVSSYTTGIYFVQVIDGKDLIISKKLIKY